MSGLFVTSPIISTSINREAQEIYWMPKKVNAIPSPFLRLAGRASLLTTTAMMLFSTVFVSIGDFGRLRLRLL